MLEYISFPLDNNPILRTFRRK